MAIPPPSSPERPPAVGKAVAPVALLIAIAGIVYLGQAELGYNHGAFAEVVYEPYYDPASIPDEPGDRNWFKEGQAVYAQSCSVCHQPNGVGNPLNGCPPLAASDWVLAEGPNRLVRIVLHGAGGPIMVSGQPWNGAMLPWKDTLTDDQVAAVLTYIRAEWGNNAAPVTPEQVAAIREKEAGRGAPWTAAELLKIPEK